MQLPELHQYWVILRRRADIYVDAHSAPSLELAMSWAQRDESDRQGTDVTPEVLAVLDSEKVVWGDVTGIPSDFLPAGHPVRGHVEAASKARYSGAGR